MEKDVQTIEVYVKENLGDITKVQFSEIKREGETIFSYEKSSFYSSNDEVLLVYTGDSNLFKAFTPNEKKNNSTFILKKNGAIIETNKNDTTNIINYYTI